MDEKSRWRIGLGAGAAATFVAAGGAVAIDRDLFALIMAAFAVVSLIWGRWPDIQRRLRSRRGLSSGHSAGAAGLASLALNLAPTDGAASDRPVAMEWGKDQSHGRHLAVMALVTGSAVKTEGIVLSKLEIWSDKAERFAEGSGDVEAWIFVPTSIDPAEMAEPENNQRVFASVDAAVDGGAFLIKNHKHPPRHKVKSTRRGLWRATMRIILESGDYEDSLCFRFDGERLTPADDPTESSA